MPKEKNGYEALGEYIVKFQIIPYLLQTTIQSITNKNGLSSNFGNESKNNIISRILLTERSFSHLLHIYISLIKELFGDKSEDFIIVKKIIDFIRHNIENKRNDIIHSFMLVDENYIENIALCREKFEYNNGFMVSGEKEIPKNILEIQIKIIDEIIIFLEKIYLNIEQNYKIAGNNIIKVNSQNLNINLSIKETENFINNLKKLK